MHEPVLEEILVQAPEPRYVAPTRRDRIGRIWAPVYINNKGPFRMVLDTGANHSAVIASVVYHAAVRPEITTLRRPGNGRPIDSQVLRPITTGAPSVVRLK